MPAQTGFKPSAAFDWSVNRAERALQARWLVPLLAQPEGRVWFLQRLGAPCTAPAAQAAQPYHFVFPLRDLFTADYYQCRGKPDLEIAFITYYNRLFGLPEEFGIQEVWLTAPGGKIRHPAAGGRKGWHDDFLSERVPDTDLRQRARDLVRLLRTEADTLLLAPRHVVLVECKFKGGPATEQYDRHILMGQALARRLNKEFYFGMVVEHERDPNFARLHVPYVRWSEIEARLRWR